MDDAWRPVVSGLLGGLVATGIAYLARSRLSEVYEGRVIAELVHEYRWHIRSCAAILIGSLFAAIFSYERLGLARNDWRPLGLGFGGGAFLPIAAWFLILPRARFAELWVAITAKEGVKGWLMAILVALAAMAFFAALAGVLWN